MNIKEEKESLVEFLEKVEQELLSKIIIQERFPSRLNLIKKFSTKKPAWIDRGIFTREIYETVNELSVASELLSKYGKTLTRLEYEPPLTQGDRTIDFLVIIEGDKKIYCDVKTIFPITQDDWKKYIKSVHESRFPDRVGITLFQDGMGGETWHNWVAARSKMLEYTLEFEQKIKNNDQSDDTIYIMIFCGNNSSWSLDDLEDFADFYRNGKHRQDDPFSKMESHYIEKKNIQLLRNINYFGYLDRKIRNIEVKQFVLGVKGTDFFS